MVHKGRCHTMFGKIMDHYFTKDMNTSWVIDILEKKHDDVYSIDALRLYRMFHMHLSNPNNAIETKSFCVSLYIKRDEDCKGPHFDSKLTLSKMKKAYAEQSFTKAEAERDTFLSVLTNSISTFDWSKNAQDIIFDTTITFKAQALVNFSERGKTKVYHIVGMTLEG